MALQSCNLKAPSQLVLANNDGANDEKDAAEDELLQEDTDDVKKASLEMASVGGSGKLLASGITSSSMLLLLEPCGCPWACCPRGFSAMLVASGQINPVANNAKN